MSKIHFGRAVSEIPIDKIYDGMRVALKNDENYILGTVLKTKKNVFWTFSIPKSHEQNIQYSNKQNVIVVDFDNAFVKSNIHHDMSNFFCVEENK